MSSAEYIKELFAKRKMDIPAKRMGMLDAFANSDSNRQLVKQIIENQERIMNDWKLKARIADIIELPLRIANATAGKPYMAPIDIQALGSDIAYYDFEALELYGLTLDKENNAIVGTPTVSGDFKVKMRFKLNGEEEGTELNVKLINLVINADPKSLWKNIASDVDKDDAWRTANSWKPDNVEEYKPLGEKHIVVASKRGRSHANVGSFRDDDYAFKHFEDTGWSLVAVADGAGSAKLARKGSQLACRTVVEYFETNLPLVNEQFDTLIKGYKQPDAQLKETNEPATPQVEGEEAKLSDEPVAEPTNRQISLLIYNLLGNGARTVHKRLEEYAAANGIGLKDLHSTLIFALYKKCETGYVILSFSVGDCPMCVLSKDMTSMKLMNWLDVGEFGGGTRFITMPDIFASDKFATRLGFKVMDDFSYLFLMTDGIYDPKFVVEANLEKLEKWTEFVADLQGNNEDGAKVDFEVDNAAIAQQLSTWMDFWNSGNHDDRTLAIVF